MSPETEHTTSLRDQTSPVLDVKEPSANCQLVPVNTGAPSEVATVNPQHSAIDALSPQLSTLALQPTGRIRLGKIARLPKQFRDMVCRMMRNNCSARKIVDALEEFGIKVTQRNISNWKTRGGYAQWCFEEDRAAEIRLQQDHLLQYLRKEQASQIPEVGLQLAASQMSRYLLQPEAVQQLVANPDDYARVVGALCRVTGQIHSLQKYRDECARSLGWKHNPERVRRQSEQEIEEVRENYTSTPPQSAREDPIPHRNFMSNGGMSECPVDPPSQEKASKKPYLEMMQQAMAVAKQPQASASAESASPVAPKQT